jgi:hypothetical protein
MLSYLRDGIAAHNKHGASLNEEIGMKLIKVGIVTTSCARPPLSRMRARRVRIG